MWCKMTERSLLKTFFPDYNSVLERLKSGFLKIIFRIKVPCNPLEMTTGTVFLFCLHYCIVFIMYNAHSMILSLKTFTI